MMFPWKLEALPSQYHRRAPIEIFAINASQLWYLPDPRYEIVLFENSIQGPLSM